MRFVLQKITQPISPLSLSRKRLRLILVRHIQQAIFRNGLYKAWLASSGCRLNSVTELLEYVDSWSIRWLLVHDDVIKWKHFPRYWPFVRGIHRSPVNSPHKGQWRGALMFSLICAQINGWINNGEAGDLRPNHAHYDVTVMYHCERMNPPLIKKHDDVVKWKHFPRYWPFVRGINRSPELWCFLWFAPEQTVCKQSRRRWFDTPSRSLWHHCNEYGWWWTGGAFWRKFRII